MTGRVLTGTRVRATLQLREPPIDAPDFIELRAADGSRVYLHRGALRDAMSLTRVHLPNETGAVLMGATFTDGFNPFTIVTDLVVPLPGEVIGTSATVTITAAGRRRMELEGRLRDPLAYAVGWMHSHPVQSAFFSGTDEIEQSKWTSPASVGLVVSGRRDADPRYRIFLGADSAEAHAVPFEEEMERPGGKADGAGALPAAEWVAATGPERGDSRAHAEAGALPDPADRPLRTLRRAPDERPRRRARALRRRRAVAAAALACLVVLALVLVVLAYTGDGSGGEPRGATPAIIPAENDPAPVTGHARSTVVPGPSVTRPTPRVSAASGGGR